VGDDLPLIGSYHMQVRFVIVIGAMLLLPLERFTQFLLFWTLAVLFGLTVAGEKMPWLHVHLALPVAILAAKVLHDLLTRADLKLEKLKLPPLERWAPFGYAALAAALAVVVFIVAGPASLSSIGGWALALAALGTVVWVARAQSEQAALKVGAVALVGALAVFTLRAGILASWGHPNLPQLQAKLGMEDHGDTPVEMLVYTQTSPDIPVLRDEIERLAASSGLGHDLPIEVDSELAWPWVWYLRDYNHVGYPAFSEDYQPPTGTVLLVWDQNAGHLNLSLENFSEGVPFTHRWWFPEGGTYRGLTVEDFFADLFDSATWDAWRGYFIDRELVPGLGTMDGMAYFPQGFEVSRPPTPAPTPPAEVETVRVEDGQLVIGGFGAAAGQLSQPAGLAVDAEGNLYVADSLNHRLQKHGPDGHYLMAVGSLGGEQGQFNEPWSVTVDAQGNIYVADTWNHRIQKFDPDLNLVAVWGQPAIDLDNPGPYDLFGPRDITVDPDGNLLVTDTGNKRVLKFSPEGEHLATYGKGGSGPGEFNEPVGVAVGPGGDIYVADAWNRRIQRFDADFTYLGEIEVESWGSEGVTDKPYIAVLADGRVLATDPANARVLVFDAEGDLVATWELPGGRPVGIALTADGQVYVSDGVASEVRRVPLETVLGE
jgi:DNA-binding beta-propeller fold protein YncE